MPRFRLRLSKGFICLFILNSTFLLVFILILITFFIYLIINFFDFVFHVYFFKFLFGFIFAWCYLCYQSVTKEIHSNFFPILFFYGIGIAGGAFRIDSRNRSGANNSYLNFAIIELSFKGMYWHIEGFRAG